MARQDRLVLRVKDWTRKGRGRGCDWVAFHAAGNDSFEMRRKILTWELFHSE